MERRRPGVLHKAIGFAGTLLAASPLLAQPAPGATERVIGVDVGSDLLALSRVGRAAGVRCQPAAPGPASPSLTAVPRAAYVCQPPPVPTPFAAIGTYWYEGGKLSSAYLVGTESPTRFADYESAYQAALWAFGGRLGAPDALDQLPADWEGRSPLPDPQRLRELRAGRMKQSALWHLEGATFELALRGENGRAVLVASLVQAAAGPAPGCEPEAVRDAALDLFAPADEATRAQSARQLGICRVGRAAGALDAALANDTSPIVRADALRALVAVGRPPGDRALAALASGGAGPVARAVEDIRARRRWAEAARRAEATRVYSPAGPPGEIGESDSAVATGLPPPPQTATSTPTLAPAGAGTAPATHAAPVTDAHATPTAAPSEPWSGTPLLIAASTLAGTTLMRNLGLMGGEGLSSVTPQLLLGSAGAIIGFGTSFGLSRLGVHPTVEQSAWFANVTAWGTLAGLTAWSASSSTNPKFQYGALALGEVAGLGLGAYSARQWRWTGPQIALADAMVLGSALAVIGVPLVRDQTPHVDTAEAIGLPLVMAAAAVAAHQMNPTTSDLRLMMFGALAGGWTGGLIAAGATGNDFLASRPSRGGVMIGAGVGFLGAAAASAFVEADGVRVGVASAGLAAGEVLGLGLQMSIAAFAHDDGPGATFSAGERQRWALGAGLGGIALGAAGYAYAPHLHLGPSAAAMTIEGALYGAGVWWLALAAASHESPTDVDQARLTGGLLTGAALGGLTGLVSSRWFAPDEAAQATTAATMALGVAGGLGLARLVTHDQGSADFIGVTLGAGVGFAGGALLAHETQLRLPDVGAGVAGAAFGALVGTLAPTLRDPTWDGGRTANGGAWLGLGLGGAGAVAAAHLTDATGGEIAVPVVGATLGLVGGLGAGLLVPCEPGSCTSRAPRIGTVAGALGGGTLALILDRELELSEGLGPLAAKLGVLGGAFGAVDGLLLAGALDSSGRISETPTRQLEGGALMAGSAELAVGLLLSKRLSLRDGDVALFTSGRVAGGLIGLGTAMLVQTETGRADSLATLGGSFAGLGAALLLDRQLQLSEGLGPSAAKLGVLGGAFGVTDGLLLAGALDSSGRISETPARQLAGGALMAGTAELSVGLLLSKRLELRDGDAAVVAGGRVAGGLIGLGTAMLARTETGRTDTLATLGGSLAGLGAATATQVLTPLESTDGGALALGASAGALVGTLAPTLDAESWADTSARRRAGGLLLGLGAGAVTGVALRHETGAPARTIELTAMGGLDGLASGIGVGLLVEADASSRPARIGAVAGTAAGLGMGALVWPHLALDDGNASVTALAAAAVGGWTGAWLPSLGHASRDSVDSQHTVGGLLAGAGLATAASMLVEPALHPDPDLVANAVTFDVLFTGAGAGVGALASTRDDAPVWGMLTAGTAGLLLGGALHRSIEIDGDDAPLLTLATAEGLWLGGWLPNAIAEPGSVTARQRAGGLAAGGFGAVGLAGLASGKLELAPATAGSIGLGSAIGAALGGGVALVSPGLHDRGGVGLMLGGTGVGLAAGAALAPRLALTPAATEAEAILAGATLGASESLLFAWSGRADSGAAYGGAALIGGGVGATLGLAATATPADRSGNLPAAAGFAAWGAWTGSFTGALVQNDSHAVVLGGLVGANAGFLAGYALLHSDTVDPNDFGWLSLFGALGTVAGAGAGAPFSTRSQPAPVLAGLAIGPVVGMLGGALLLPRLHRWSNKQPGSPSRSSTLPPSSFRASTDPSQALTVEGESGTPAHLAQSSDVNASLAQPFWRSLRNIVDVTQWSPLVGALPAPGETGTPPFLFGLTGLWR